MPPPGMPLAQRRFRRPPAARLLPALLLAALLLLGLLAPSRALQPTTPEPPAALSSPFHSPAFYPLELQPAAGLYVPHADWMGRLILPAPEHSGGPDDWVWIELEQTPEALRSLRGRTLRLEWADQPELRSLVRAVSTDIHLGEPARRAAARGDVVPVRLDGRRAVGPLESLAGARPQDDVVVRLEGVRVEGERLRIDRPPIQTTGRWSALVQLQGPVAGTDRFRVRHYERASGGFSGPLEEIRLPRQPPDRHGRRPFDPTGLAASPLNREGWTVHGAPAADGIFTVQAIEPRALMRLGPDRIVQGSGASLRALRREVWGPEPLRRGSSGTLELRPTGGASPWRLGERGLVVHGFGGIGGPGGEPTPGWTVTGHFAFGQAEVVRDPFSGEPRFAITYHQIYANNPNGIVAGSQDWSAYAGNLQRGWLGLRPIADALVPLDGPLLPALLLQSELISARYRSGDGGGVALVTPATSCVQDSSQALWIALAQLGDAAPAGDHDPERLAWLRQVLDELLTPFGIVRPDWRHNAGVSREALGGVDLATAGVRSPFRSSQGPAAVLLSWRSMLPRRAGDDLSRLFLRAGLPLHVLRTNQIPGADPRLAPLAPTTLLGRLPLAGILLQRVSDALVPPPLQRGLGTTLLVLGVYAVFALPLGLRSGFLPDPWRWPTPGCWLRQGAWLLVTPALVEEVLFRVLLLPHPLEGEPLPALLGWSALSVGAFVLYHPLAARLWYAPGRRLFRDRRFLLQCTLLGLACVVAYQATGSLWAAVLIHWLAVLLWLEPLGGRRWLETGTAPPALAS
ncbi:MAG: CPBP family glutamic-type intramembrane protease [Synechococcus sp.]|nr:CPBP family glutamic-type intramembrane protease [Synechococcus sp.]